jgi:hypothetical protein
LSHAAAKPGELNPEALAVLEQLDDVIFAAISGDPDALDRAASVWQQAVHALGRESVEESRSQYLRYAQAEWHRLRSEVGHAPHKIFAAMEVIALLGSG